MAGYTPRRRKIVGRRWEKTRDRPLEEEEEEGLINNELSRLR